MMDKIKIYHNPHCSKSRQTLKIIQELGHEPEVIKYLDQAPSIEDLTMVLDLLDINPRELMRKGEGEYKENNMQNPVLSKAELIVLMNKHPKVIERPIVVYKNKAVIGRPPASVIKILPK